MPSTTFIKSCAAAVIAGFCTFAGSGPAQSEVCFAKAQSAGCVLLSVKSRVEDSGLGVVDHVNVIARPSVEDERLKVLTIYNVYGTSRDPTEQMVKEVRKDLESDLIKSICGPRHYGSSEGNYVAHGGILEYLITLHTKDPVRRYRQDHLASLHISSCPMAVPSPDFESRVRNFFEIPNNVSWRRAKRATHFELNETGAFIDVGVPVLSMGTVADD